MGFITRKYRILRRQYIRNNQPNISSLKQNLVIGIDVCHVRFFYSSIHRYHHKVIARSTNQHRVRAFRRSHMVELWFSSLYSTIEDCRLFDVYRKFIVVTL